MSTQDYIKIAAVFHDAVTTWSDRDDVVTDTLVEVASDLASVFAADNPRFNRALFLSACGVSSY